MIDEGALEVAAAEAMGTGPSLFNYWWPDTLGRSATCELRGSMGHLYRRVFTTYNEWGFIASYTRNDRLFPSATEVRHGYTELGQLQSFAVGNASITYGYDLVGNLTNRTALSYHTGNATLAVGAHAAGYSQGNPFHRDGGYTYDVQGRLTDTPNHQVQYNRAGQVSRITASRRVNGNRSGSGEQFFLYDAFGQRVAAVREDTESVTYSIRHADGRIITEEDFALGTNDALKQRRQYITLQGKAIYLEKEDFESGQPVRKEKTHFFRDRLGNPVVTWDGETNEAMTSAYEPYGQPFIAEARHKGAHGFTGHDEDPNGLIYMKARFYDPVAGCFTQPDPGRDFNPYQPNSYNLYSYTHQNPANAVDPDGQALETVWDVANIGIGVASFVHNAREGNWLDATIDAGGVVVDTLAAAVPVVPGGAGTAIKVSRAGKMVVNAATKADKANDLRKAANTLDNAGDTAKALDKVDDAAGAAKRAGSAGGNRAGKRHTKGAIHEAKKRNAAKNNGTVKCENCGVETTPATRRTKGSTVNPREGQGDHIFPRSKGGNGATIEDQSNIDIKCAGCNNTKSDKITQ